jgi:hypothetical protein
MFDNWYNHCPKCGSLLVSRMGPAGPEYYCFCGAMPAKWQEKVVSSR